MSGVHACGQVRAAAYDPGFGIPEACVAACIRRLTSYAGGLGGRWPAQRGARGAEPARIHATMSHAAFEQSVASIRSGERGGRHRATTSARGHLTDALTRHD